MIVTAMPKSPPMLSEQTAESLAKLNHYQALGLTEGASSRDVERAIHVERWPWHLVDEEARKAAIRRRAEAYGVLSKPDSRADYDRQQEYSLWHLASFIGDDASIWGTAWVVSWSVLALLLFLGGPVQEARIIGGALAPGYGEIAVFHTSPPPPSVVPCVSNCAGYYTREFLSSSGIFHWLLNSLVIWFTLPALGVTIAMTLRTAASRACGLAVAVVRLRGGEDEIVRAICLGAVIAVPVAVLLTYGLVAPSGIQLPGSG